MPTCFAPNSVQQKSQLFLLWKRFHKRKAWLFANTPSGARASAMLYGIVETAKENGFKPADYLMRLLQELPNIGEITD